MSKKGDLSINEKKLRTYLFEKIAEKVYTLRTMEISSVCTDIIKMDSIDMNSRDVHFIKIICEALIDCLTQL